MQTPAAQNITALLAAAGGRSRSFSIPRIVDGINAPA
jgi:hypothetical protein